MDIFFPNDSSLTSLQRLPGELSAVTHLGIVAHQDDLEIMAFHGIAECYKRHDRWFAGIVCTHSTRSPREGIYASYSDEEIKKIRYQEQCAAALLGEYYFLAQLDYSSSLIARPGAEHSEDHQLSETIYQLLQKLQPNVIYTHHPLDKHPTHRAICYSAIEALRRLPQDRHPKQLLGGEVWRSLDWVHDNDKIMLDLSEHAPLLEKLLSIFQSQIAGGKRYDLATLGRYQANATFNLPERVDQASLLSYAIDLLPLLHQPDLTFEEFALGFVHRFAHQLKEELS